MLNKSVIKNQISGYLGYNFEKIRSNEITPDMILDNLVKMKVFDNKQSAIFFLLESVFKSVDDFEMTFPIKYYDSVEEFINDDYVVDDSDIENLNEEYIENMKNNM